MLEAVLDGLKHGDGYQRTETRWEYASTSRPLVDMIQAMGVIAGKPFSMTYRDDCYRMYSLGYAAQPHINDSRSDRLDIHQVEWEGQVYGMDTQYGVIAIRRDNKTLLIGSH